MYTTRRKVPIIVSAVEHYYSGWFHILRRSGETITSNSYISFHVSVLFYLIIAFRMSVTAISRQKGAAMDEAMEVITLSVFPCNSSKQFFFSVRVQNTTVEVGGHHFMKRFSMMKETQTFCGNLICHMA